MPVTVLVPSTLRGDAGDAKALSVDASGTLRAVLDEMGRRWPRLERRVRDEQGALRRYMNVYIDGVDCRVLGGADAPVTADAEVHLLPSVAGG
ncbi:molybdopterin synthase sulfur carrier subunit [Sphaerisporangium melleum]|uniref:Molybdopterin synthase sulfur carrier subunit n=1 Tax=Sphaerisporangium melleum TaxID=321316 RepID=A0A917RGY4_9ACTN|nr:MoaD/ThiS family protein [Sphaerisporangium melleum]GGL05826.1 molybdopterin synthase sulfur carrier subunit [Sphaerisporangium melleum]GII73157.1 molybdopterin synthase sulfur carrier subunit [Sphaerisporangium melleum]